MDVTPYLKAKANQLNADDLIGGSITVKIVNVARGNAEQPVLIKIDGGHMPWKPSKTALRILAAGWGTETDLWVNRFVRLYRDDSVTFGNEAVGGIRVSHMSHIAENLTLMLAISKGKKKTFRIQPLKPAEAKSEGKPTADLDALLTEEKLTRDDVDRWLASKGKPLLAAKPEGHAAFASWLASAPKTIEEIRTLRDTSEAALPACEICGTRGGHAPGCPDSEPA